MSQIDLYATREAVKTMIKNNMFGLEDELFEKYIKGKDIKIDVNPCGSWQIGGPISDCGVTGRKLVVDSYGGYCNIGGGNYSSKDYSKVDRSAAYMARYLAKNIVASGLCNNAKVELSYMIGIPEPSSINIEMDTNISKTEKVKKWITEHIDLTPYGIIKRFDGSYPRNLYLSRNGHYGVKVVNDITSALYPWEKIDFSEELKELFC